MNRRNKLLVASRAWLAASILAVAMLSAGVGKTLGNEPGPVVYQAGTVYTVEGEPISPGQVFVADGKIKAVGKSVDAGGAAVVDLGEDSVLIPGLVDAYTQSGLAADGSDEFTQELTPDFRTAHSIDWTSRSMKRRLENGTTTMCVCPGTQNVIAGIASIIKTSGDRTINDDAALVISICSDPASRNRSRSRPDSIYVRQPTNRMGVVWMLRNAMSKAKRDTDDASAIVQQAIQGKRPIFVVSRVSYDLTTTETLADEFGFQPVIVGAHEAWKVIEMLAERKFPLILSGTPTGLVYGPERSELCWNQAGKLAEAGIEFSFSGFDPLEQIRFAHRYGLDKNTALKSVTSIPAKILGVDDQVGSIAVGKDADMIALSGDPLEFTSGITWVMVDGKINGGVQRETKGN